MRRYVPLSLLLGLLFSHFAHAELPPDYKVVLLTENFPPFNMAANNKNFARDSNIQGLSADIVREMFKRAGIDYSLTLRFPWARIYQQTLETPNHGLFSTSLSEARRPLFKWVGPIAQYESVLVAATEQGVSGLGNALSFHTSQLYLALNKDTPDEVIERLQTALEQMRSEGYGSCAKNPELC